MAEDEEEEADDSRNDDDRGWHIPYESTGDRVMEDGSIQYELTDGRAMESLRDNVTNEIGGER